MREMNFQSSRLLQLLLFSQLCGGLLCFVVCHVPGWLVLVVAVMALGYTWREWQTIRGPFTLSPRHLSHLTIDSVLLRGALLLGMGQGSACRRRILLADNSGAEQRRYLLVRLRFMREVDGLLGK